MGPASSIQRVARTADLARCATIGSGQRVPWHAAESNQRQGNIQRLDQEPFSFLSLPAIRLPREHANAPRSLLKFDADLGLKLHMKALHIGKRCANSVLVLHTLQTLQNLQVFLVGK